jgi:hypothetical protein
LANGYFGAAYWHPEHQQVVIAHRGTKLTNLVAIFTDLACMRFKHHIPQMGSARTLHITLLNCCGKIIKKMGPIFKCFSTATLLEVG